jgi:hypothetical protein
VTPESHLESLIVNLSDAETYIQDAALVTSICSPNFGDLAATIGSLSPGTNKVTFFPVDASEVLCFELNTLPWERFYAFLQNCPPHPQHSAKTYRSSYPQSCLIGSSWLDRRPSCRLLSLEATLVQPNI